jgi:hypothetical protein
MQICCGKIKNQLCIKARNKNKVKDLCMQAVVFLQKFTYNGQFCDFDKRTFT